MKKLIAYYGDSPEYVDDFPKDCERSCKGSMHLIPRKPITATEGELKHLKEKHKNLRIKIIAEKAPEDPKPKEDVKDAKKPETKSEPEKVVVSDKKDLSKYRKNSTKGQRKNK